MIDYQMLLKGQPRWGLRNDHWTLKCEGTGDSDNSNFCGLWERSPFGVSVEETWRWGISAIGRILLWVKKRDGAVDRGRNRITESRICCCF